MNASNFRCDVNTTDGGVPGLDLEGGGDCNVTAAGLSLDLSNIIVYAEWTTRTTDGTLSRPFGDQDAWYATLGYRIGKFMPHITFASIDGERTVSGGSSCHRAARRVRPGRPPAWVHVPA